MFLLGIAIFLLGVVLTFVFKGVSFYILLNPAAIFMIVTALAAALTASRGFGAFWRGLRAAVSPKAFISEEERGQAASLFRLLSKTAVFAAFIVMIIGVFAALSRLDNIEILVVSLTTGLVPLLYAFVLAALFELVVLVLKKRQNAEKVGRHREQK